MIYEFEIYEKAIGKQRPRFNMYQKQAYTPQKTKNYEKMIKLSFKKKFGLKINPSENEVHIKICIQYAPPKSYSKKKKQELISGAVGYMQKPDVDNLAKAVLDALNGVVWLDDKQVTKLEIKKNYGEKDKIAIKIEEVGGNENDNSATR